MRMEARKFVSMEELERVQYYVPTTSEKVRNQRLRMLKDLAAEVLERRKAAANNMELNDACHALVNHLLRENIKPPDKVRTGFTVHALASMPCQESPKLLYRVSLEIMGDDA